MSHPIVSWLDPATLDDRQREELWHFAVRFEDISPADFLAALREQDTVVVCRRACGTVGGLISWRTVTAPDSHQTVLWGEMGMLDREFRGRFLTERAFLYGLAKARLRHPFSPVYVMAEAATLNGYLMLMRIFSSVWPRPGHPIPPSERLLVDHVLHRLGSADWDGARGVFHRGKSVRAEPNEVPPKLRPLADFYAAANPGQRDGDSLLCVVPVPWHCLALIPTRSIAALLHSRRTHPARDADGSVRKSRRAPVVAPAGVEAVKP